MSDASPRTRIVVLDGHTLNPGDLSWDPLRALGEVIIHDRTPPEQVVRRAAGAGAVFTNKVVLNAPVLDRLPDLKYIGVLATGYNVVEVDAAAARGITVTNVPAYSTESVAQLTLALLLELTHRTGDHWAAVRAGRWSQGPDFSFHDHPLVELSGAVMGILGYGRIGRKVGEIAKALGMGLLVHTRSPTPGDGIAYVDLETLFREADVVSLHCPLTADTSRVVDAGRLAVMKPTAYLLNTARGPLVDETALAAALNSGRIAGAGLDVLSVEPPPSTNPLLAARNCIITPHIAWATAAARRRLMDTAVSNFRAWLAGASVNVVA